jgi:hypothetical protein
MLEQIGNVATLVRKRDRAFQHQAVISQTDGVVKGAGLPKFPFYTPEDADQIALNCALDGGIFKPDVKRGKSVDIEDSNGSGVQCRISRQFNKGFIPRWQFE